LVAILLLGIFTAAATEIVIQGTAVSANNGARIVAAGLAQRELNLVSETMGLGADGAASLLSPATAINPNVASDMVSDDADFAFRVDGRNYRVERTTSRQVIGAGSPCNSTTGADDITQFALSVAVRVSWQGMGASTKPHVAAKLFAPHREASSGIGDDQAVFGVSVKGTTDPSNPARANVRVQMTGGGTNEIAVTDAKGCAIFSTTPLASGEDYEFTLLGHTGSTVFVNMGQEQHPTKTEFLVTPRESRAVSFTEYDPAGSLTVTGVPAAATAVTMLPATGGVSSVTVDVEGGTAIFPALWPGVYSLVTDGSPQSVTLQPGQHIAMDLGAGAGAPAAAVLNVCVDGTATPPSVPRAGVTVRVSSAGGDQSEITDTTGCVAFTVGPPASGGSYDIVLLGHTSAVPYVDKAHQLQPAITETSVMPGSSRNVTFPDYDPAASLTVTGVPGAATTVTLFGASGGGATIAANVTGGTATFASLWPGVYTYAGTGFSGTITLGPGQDASINAGTP
jgi:hypothetical protein